MQADPCIGGAPNRYYSAGGHSRQAHLHVRCNRNHDPQAQHSSAGSTPRTCARRALRLVQERRGGALCEAARDGQQLGVVLRPAHACMAPAHTPTCSVPEQAQHAAQCQLYGVISSMQSGCTPYLLKGGPFTHAEACGPTCLHACACDGSIEMAWAGQLRGSPGLPRTPPPGLPRAAPHMRARAPVAHVGEGRAAELGLQEGQQARRAQRGRALLLRQHAVLAQVDQVRVLCVRAAWSGSGNHAPQSACTGRGRMAPRRSPRMTWSHSWCPTFLHHSRGSRQIPGWMRATTGQSMHACRVLQRRAAVAPRVLGRCRRRPPHHSRQAAQHPAQLLILHAPPTAPVAIRSTSMHACLTPLLSAGAGAAACILCARLSIEWVEEGFQRGSG